MKRIIPYFLILNIFSFTLSCKKDNLAQSDNKETEKDNQKVFFLKEGKKRANVHKKVSRNQLLSINSSQIRTSFNYIMLDHAADGYYYEDVSMWGESLDFVQDLNADDLTMIEIWLDVEDEFNIEISDEEFETLHTIGDWLNTIGKKLDDNTPLTKEEIITNQFNNMKGIEDEWSFQASSSSNPNFNDVSTFMDYLNNLSFSSSRSSAIDTLLEFRVTRGLYTGEDIFINIKKNVSTNLWEVQSVTSDDWGLSLGTSWIQNTYSVSTNNHIITVILLGYKHFNIIIDGVGTFYKQKIKYRMQINDITGNAVSIAKIN